VKDALAEADVLRTETGEPLIVVAHSMGGNIVYDLLTSSLTGLHVDTFVTVGSQVAVLEELKLFRSSDPAIPKSSSMKMVPKPANIGRWLNVFDTHDPLAFAIGRVFDDVEDYRFATGRVWAHGGYFLEPTFHQRLGVRLGGGK
jgi:pimeloyl-ACP methyl ester carboxylesterase